MATPAEGLARLRAAADARAARRAAAATGSAGVARCSAARRGDGPAARDLAVRGDPAASGSPEIDCLGLIRMISITASMDAHRRRSPGTRPVRLLRCSGAGWVPRSSLARERRRGASATRLSPRRCRIECDIAGRADLDLVLAGRRARRRARRSTLSLIFHMFRDPRERSVAVGVWIGAFSAGSAVGPVLGGLMLEVFWWGSVFRSPCRSWWRCSCWGPACSPSTATPTPDGSTCAAPRCRSRPCSWVVYGLKQLAQDGVARGLGARGPGRPGHRRG